MARESISFEEEYAGMSIEQKTWIFDLLVQLKQEMKETTRKMKTTASLMQETTSVLREMVDSTTTSSRNLFNTTSSAANSSSLVGAASPSSTSTPSWVSGADSTEFVDRASDLDQDAAAKLGPTQPGSGVVTVRDGHRMPEVCEEDRQGKVLNYFEASLKHPEVHSHLDVVVDAHLHLDVIPYVHLQLITKTSSSSALLPASSTCDNTSKLGLHPVLATSTSTNIYTSTSTNCSTKCTSHVVDVVALGAVTALAKDVVLDPDLAVAASRCIDIVPSNSNTDAYTECSMKCPGWAGNAVMFSVAYNCTNITATSSNVHTVPRDFIYNEVLQTALPYSELKGKMQDVQVEEPWLFPFHGERDADRPISWPFFTIYISHCWKDLFWHWKPPWPYLHLMYKRWITCTALKVFIFDPGILMDGFSNKDGQLDAARGLFNQMLGWNVIFRNVLGEGYVRWGKSLDMLTMFWLLKMEDLEPDQFTFAGYLSAYAAICSLKFLGSEDGLSAFWQPYIISIILTAHAYVSALDVGVLAVLVMQCIMRQGWPPPILMEISLDNASMRPIPRPNFSISDLGSAATWCFSWLLKSPWPSLSQKHFAYVVTERTAAHRFIRGELLKFVAVCENWFKKSVMWSIIFMGLNLPWLANGCNQDAALLIFVWLLPWSKRIMLQLDVTSVSGSSVCIGMVMWPRDETWASNTHWFELLDNLVLMEISKTVVSTEYLLSDIDMCGGFMQQRTFGKLHLDGVKTKRLIEFCAEQIIEEMLVLSKSSGKFCTVRASCGTKQIGEHWLAVHTVMVDILKKKIVSRVLDFLLLILKQVIEKWIYHRWGNQCDSIWYPQRFSSACVITTIVKKGKSELEKNIIGADVSMHHVLITDNMESKKKHCSVDSNFKPLIYPLGGKPDVKEGGMSWAGPAYGPMVQTRTRRKPPGRDQSPQKETRQAGVRSNRTELVSSSSSGFGLPLLLPL